MKVVLVVAISKDGFITKSSDPIPGNWTSDADKQFFAKLQKNFSLQVMGSTTYDVFKPSPDPNILRVVLTTSPDRYKERAIPGQIEFITTTAEEFVHRYEKTFDACLLLGGSQVYSEFIDARLVDELFITIEPVINHAGVPFLTHGRTITDIQLPDPIVTKLNDDGTELHHYIVKK